MCRKPLHLDDESVCRSCIPTLTGSPLVTACLQVVSNGSSPSTKRSKRATKSNTAQLRPPPMVEPSTALILAWFASKSRSLFAAQCLVDTVLQLYLSGNSLSDIQVCVCACKLHGPLSLSLEPSKLSCLLITQTVCLTMSAGPSCQQPFTRWRQAFYGRWVSDCIRKLGSYW